ncbi:MAG: VWA domain-containing protein [Ruminococcaceae bacterium]|nr:VWA domain-containing protein [Oscillospiraceae bacterium]
MTCPKCGFSSNPEGASFCAACSTPLNQSTTSITPYSQTDISPITYDNAAPQYAPVYQPAPQQPVRDNKRTVLIALIAVVAVALVVFLLAATGTVKLNKDACSEKTPASDSSDGTIDAGDLIDEYSDAAAKLKKIDVVFIVDTTSSMGDDVEQLNKDLAVYIAALKQKCTDDYKIALIDYRDFAMNTFDSDDYPYKVQLDFSNKTSKIYNAFGNLHLGYGGDWEETAFSAIIDGCSELSWRKDAVRVAIIVTDAPAQDPEYATGYTSSDVKSYLKKNNIALFVIDSANDSDVKSCFSTICKSSGGFYQGISKTAEITDAMAEILDEVSAYVG